MGKTIFRTCIESHIKCDRNNLFRVVKTPLGEIKIDINYSIKGRGVYISKDKSVILSAKKRNSLSRGLRNKVNEEIYDELLNIL